MRIGVPKEIKVHEYRVGLTPAAVQEAVGRGHQVWVETQAGTGSGFSDQAYRQAGATIVDSSEAVFAEARLIVKVKEPQASERRLLTPGHTLFTYLHLAPDPEQTQDLLASGATCIAYETVTAPGGGLPLLTPMSEVAGRLAPQVGAAALQRAAGGRGILLGGVAGVEPGQVLVLGGGVVGSQAARIALGMGAQVTVVDRDLNVLRRLADTFGPALHTVFSTREALERLLPTADLVIGGVLIPGAAAPKLINATDLALLQPGAVLVDVAIDQGGCFATSQPTTHAEPTYVVDGIVHYCVANMPGAVPRTSTLALTHATLPFVLALAELGPRKALEADPHLRAGLNVAAGQLTYEAVGQALGLPCVSPETVISRLT